MSTVSSNTSNAVSNTPAVAVDRSAIVLLLFVISGATALMYQVTFVRAFVELYGSTTGAFGAVIAAFLGCLALGAALGGWFASKSSPLRAYALLEGAAAIGGWLIAWGLPRLQPLATLLAQQSLAGANVATWRFAIAGLVMALPIVSLGGTLPVLAKFRVQDRPRGFAAGSLQVANTFGAVIGSLLAVTWLLPAFGIRAGLAFIAALNLTLAVASLWLERMGPRGETVAASATSVDDTPVAATPFLLASLVTGFVVVALEVLFFRGLAQVTRGSLDTLGVLLATFLLANGAGGCLGLWFSRSGKRARSGFVTGIVGTALGVLWGLWMLFQLASMTPWPWLLAGQQAVTHWGRLAGEALTATVVLAPAAFFAGVAFPCVCQLQPRRQLGFASWVSWQVVMWTVGAILAGLIVPNWFFTTLGLRQALLVCAATLSLPLLLAFLLEHQSFRSGPSGSIVAVAILAIAALLFVPAGEGQSLWRDPLVFAHTTADHQLVAYGEGKVANVSVLQGPRGKVLKVNNTLSLGGSGVTRVEGIQGLLPAILRGECQRALVLGVGAGVTVGRLRDYGVEQVDAVELVPLVINSLPLFDEENGGLSAARNEGAVKIIDADARTFVRGVESNQYDLVVGDLYFPWLSDNGFLYTREHFEEIQRILKPGGVFCQWVPTHQLRWEELGIVGRTFADVYRRCTVWLARADFPFPVIGLIGGKEELEFDIGALEEWLDHHPQHELLTRHGLADVHQLSSLYIGGPFLFANPNFEREDLNTIERPIVEFLASQRIESDGVTALHNRRRLFELREDIVGRISTIGMDLKERAELQRELSNRAKVTASIFEATTLRLTAEVNRGLPEEQRVDDPELLELAAFNQLGTVLRVFPEDPETNDQMVELLLDQMRRQRFDIVVQATSSLLDEETIGSQPRFHNLRGMALFLAWCSEDSKALFADPLRHAKIEFDKAWQADRELVEAGVHLGIVAFLNGEEDEARATLAAARAKIRAPEHEEGHALPAMAEAIYQVLIGEPEKARASLQRANPRLPYFAPVFERLESALSGSQQT